MATVMALEPDQRDVKHRLVKLVVRVLRPLVRMLLRNGMSCQEFNEIARWVYVDVAMTEREFALKSRSRQFKSRAAVITGLSRKEVLRLSERGGVEGLMEAEPYNRAARVLRGWMENPLFCVRTNKPKELPIKDAAGSFHDLVRLYSGDVPPRAVLDELRRCGAVEIIDGERVRFKRFAYFAQGNSKEELDAVETLTGSLLETMDHNMAGKESAVRTIAAPSSSRLPETAMEDVRAFINSEIDATARRVSRYIEEREDKTKRSGKPYRRAGLGLFHFES